MFEEGFRARLILGETTGKDRLFVAFFLAFIAFVVYANSLPGVFIQDDLMIVRDNIFVRDFDLLGMLRSDYWGAGLNTGLYRPMTLVSLAVNRLILGQNPLGYHLVNILLHAGVVVAIWYLLVQWGVKGSVAIFAALLFAVHPIHTEVVDVIVGRSELLAALFLLLAFICAGREGGRSWFAVIFYAAALLSKEHAITFVVLLPLADAFFAGNLAIWRRRIPLYAVLIVTTITWLAIRVYIHHGITPLETPSFISPLYNLPLVSRSLSALQYQAVYLGKLAVPLNLQIVYSAADLPPIVDQIFSVRALLIIVGTVALVTVLYWGVTRKSLLAFFALLYFIAFSPTSNVFVPIGVAVAERLTYFPSIWFCAVVAYLCGQLAQRGKMQIVLWCGAAGFLLIVALLCLNRNRLYASELQLWSAEVRQNERDSVAWLNLAEILNKSRRFYEAEQAYARVFELTTNFESAMRSQAYFLMGQGRYREALVSVQRALVISRQKNDPIVVAALVMDLAEIYLGLQEPATALRYLDGVGALTYGADRALELRKQALSAMGKEGEAVELAPDKL